MKHCAMNLLTFEVIGTNTGNHLKRSLKIHKRYHGPGIWIFSHHGFDMLNKKYYKNESKGLYDQYKIQELKEILL